MTLIAAPDSNANCYATVETADAYFSARPSRSAWDAVTADDKEAALLAASETLDTIKWAGNKTDSTQPMAFPRRWVPTLEVDAEPDIIATDFIDTSQMFYDESTLPTPLVRMTCELALVIAQSGTTSIFAGDTKRVKSKTIGPISTTYFDSQDGLVGLAKYPQVLRIGQHMMRSAGGIEVQRA